MQLERGCSLHLHLNFIMPATFLDTHHCSSVHSVPWHWCTWVSSPWWFSSVRGLPSCLGGEKNTRFLSNLSGKLSQLPLLFHFNKLINKSILETAPWHLGHQDWLGGRHRLAAWSPLPPRGWGWAILSSASIHAAFLHANMEIATIDIQMRQMASLSSCQRDCLVLFALYCQLEAFAKV